MEPFVCPECAAEHAEGGAELGHRQLCPDCRLASDLLAEATTPVERPLAA